MLTSPQTSRKHESDSGQPRQCGRMTVVTHVSPSPKRRKRRQLLGGEKLQEGWWTPHVEQAPHKGLVPLRHLLNFQSRTAVTAAPARTAPREMVMHSAFLASGEGGEHTTESQSFFKLHSQILPAPFKRGWHIKQKFLIHLKMRLKILRTGLGRSYISHRRSHDKK